jgi:hypothetical protein
MAAKREQTACHALECRIAVHPDGGGNTIDEWSDSEVRKALAARSDTNFGIKGPLATL